MKNSLSTLFISLFVLFSFGVLSGCHGTTILIESDRPKHEHEKNEKDGVSHCHEHKHPEGVHDHCHDHGYGEGGHH